MSSYAIFLLDAARFTCCKPQKYGKVGVVVRHARCPAGVMGAGREPWQRAATRIIIAHWQCASLVLPHAALILPEGRASRQARIRHRAWVWQEFLAVRSKPESQARNRPSASLTLRALIMPGACQEISAHHQTWGYQADGGLRLFLGVNAGRGACNAQGFRLQRRFRAFWETVGLP